MSMNIVGAVSRAGEKHTVLFCEFSGSEQETALLDAFLNGLNISLNRENVYCLAVYTKEGESQRVVGVYYHKDSTECMAYERPFEYLNAYVADIFSEEMEEILGKGKGSDDEKAD